MNGVENIDLTSFVVKLSKEMVPYTFGPHSPPRAYRQATSVRNRIFEDLVWVEALDEPNHWRSIPFDAGEGTVVSKARQFLRPVGKRANGALPRSRGGRLATPLSSDTLIDRDLLAEATAGSEDWTRRNEVVAT